MLGFSFHGKNPFLKLILQTKNDGNNDDGQVRIVVDGINWLLSILALLNLLLIFSTDLIMISVSKRTKEYKIMSLQTK